VTQPVEVNAILDRFQWGLGIFPFTASRMALGPTQEALSLGVKEPGCDTDHSPASSAKVRE